MNPVHGDTRTCSVANRRNCLQGLPHSQTLTHWWGWGGRLLPHFLCANCLCSRFFIFIFYSVCHRNFIVAFRKDKILLKQLIGFFVWTCLPVSTKWPWKIRIWTKYVLHPLTWYILCVMNQYIGEKWAHSPWHYTKTAQFILHSPRLFDAVTWKKKAMNSIWVQTVPKLKEFNSCSSLF